MFLQTQQPSCGHEEKREHDAAEFRRYSRRRIAGEGGVHEKSEPLNGGNSTQTGTAICKGDWAEVHKNTSAYLHLFLFMSVLTETLFPFMRRHFMSFSLLTAWHRVEMFIG